MITPCGQPQILPFVITTEAEGICDLFRIAILYRGTRKLSGDGVLHPILSLVQAAVAALAAQEAGDRFEHITFVNPDRSGSRLQRTLREMDYSWLLVPILYRGTRKLSGIGASSDSCRLFRPP